MHVSLPDSATVDERSSSCREADGSSWMVALFGSGHTLGLRFTTNGSLYSVANLTLQYNLSDTSIFRDASETGENERRSSQRAPMDVMLVETITFSENPALRNGTDMLGQHPQPTCRLLRDGQQIKGYIVELAVGFRRAIDCTCIIFHPLKATKEETLSAERCKE